MPEDGVFTLAVRIKEGVSKHFSERITEWQNGIILFGIGLWALNPLIQTNAGPSYVLINTYMPEGIFGLICLGLGGLRIIVLVINGTFHKSPYVRMILAVLSCLIWFGLWFSVCLTPNPIYGVILYPILFVVDTYNAFHATRDAKVTYVEGYDAYGT